MARAPPTAVDVGPPIIKTCTKGETPVAAQKAGGMTQRLGVLGRPLLGTLFDPCRLAYLAYTSND